MIESHTATSGNDPIEAKKTGGFLGTLFSLF